ncbi:hypothetical protein BaRGS_00028469, partial [Batillaria attramentaria]
MADQTNADSDTSLSVFVGRHAEREELKTRLSEGKRARVLLLYGQPMVGKASLAKQVAEDLCAENPRPLVTVDCNAACDWPGVMKALCMTLSLDEANPNETLLLEAFGRRAGTGGLLLLLLRLHRLYTHSQHELSRFLNNLADYDVITMVTSRRCLNLPSAFQVGALSEADALQLLALHAPKIKAEDFAGIVKQCHGLPPLVLQVARLVNGNPVLAYTADELKQALEEDPILLMRGLGKQAGCLLPGLSQEETRHMINLAQLLDGTFSMEALQAVLGTEGPRAKTVLRRLCEESSVIVDTDAQRMRVEPLTKYYVRQVGHLAADDRARLRVVTLFGRALVRAEQDMYLKEEDTVYGCLQGQWPQLQHVLRQAIHCTDMTYKTFLKACVLYPHVTEYRTLLARCLPEESVQFFSTMSAVAEQYGTSRDQAELQGLAGIAMTNTRDMTGWRKALDCFERVLPALRQHKPSLFLARVLAVAGVTYWRHNQLRKAERYLKEAMKVCQTADASYEQMVFLLIQIRSWLALPVIYRGKYAIGKELVRETLSLCDAYAPYHPQKTILINTLGHAYERKSAFKCLEESVDIMGNDCHYYTAVAHNGLGRLCLSSGDYKRAERHLLEACRIYPRCSPGHEAHAEVTLALAHVYVTPLCRDVRSVEKCLDQVLELCQAESVDLSDEGLAVAVSALQHNVQLDGWQIRHNKHLLDWALEQLDKYGKESPEVREHQNILGAIARLGFDATDEEIDVVRSQVLSRCPMCVALQRSADGRSLWLEVEHQTKKQRHVLAILTRSDALQKALGAEDEAHQSEPSDQSRDINSATREDQRRMLAKLSSSDALQNALGGEDEVHQSEPSVQSRDINSAAREDQRRVLAKLSSSDALQNPLSGEDEVHQSEPSVQSRDINSAKRDQAVRYEKREAGGLSRQHIEEHRKVSESTSPGERSICNQWIYITNNINIHEMKGRRIEFASLPRQSSTQSGETMIDLTEPPVRVIADERQAALNSPPAVHGIGDTNTSSDVFLEQRGPAMGTRELGLSKHDGTCSPEVVGSQEPPAALNSHPVHGTGVMNTSLGAFPRQGEHRGTRELGVNRRGGVCSPEVGSGHEPPQAALNPHPVSAFLRQRGPIGTRELDGNRRDGPCSREVGNQETQAAALDSPSVDGNGDMNTPQREGPCSESPERAGSHEPSTLQQQTAERGRNPEKGPEENDGLSYRLPIQ